MSHFQYTIISCNYGSFPFKKFASFEGVNQKSGSNFFYKIIKLSATEIDLAMLINHVF